MKSAVSPQKILMIGVVIYFFLNSVLFILRESDVNWWIGDYQAYAGVSSDLHLEAFIFFLLYLAIFVVVICVTVKKGRVLCANVGDAKKNHCCVGGDKGGLKFLFFVVVVLLTAQAVFALVDSVGVAGVIGKAPVYSLPLLLVSPDGVYYAYALSERNRNRFFFATLIFILSNLVRGWAGFFVSLALIFYLRGNAFSKIGFFVTFVLGFFIVVPVLFVVRDYFRGGYPIYQLLADSGLSGVLLFSEYFVVSMKLILSRFDFYSNYIGVSQIFGGGLPGYVCLPLVENVFSKIVFYPFGGLDCISLGSVLPGELYEFFRDKGTSFAIVGGFFALPLEDALPYFLSYFSVLLVASIIVFRFINVRVYSSFFVYLALVLLFQGWMYQFFYNFLGFLLGVFLQRFVWSKGSRNAIGAGAALASKVAIRSN